MYNISNEIWNIDGKIQPITSINSIHKNQTRLVQKKLSSNSIRTNLGKSVIKFVGPIIWTHKNTLKTSIQKKNIKKFFSIHTTNFFNLRLCIFFCVPLFLFFAIVVVALILLCSYISYLYTYSICEH